MIRVHTTLDLEGSTHQRNSNASKFYTASYMEKKRIMIHGLSDSVLGPSKRGGSYTKLGVLANT